MWRKGLWSIAVTLLLLVCPSQGAAAQADDAQAELWKNEKFIKRAQAIKAGDWEEATSKELAIVGLYEMGRVVDTKMKLIEDRLEREIQRLYEYAWIGTVAVGAYLALQLLLTLVLIVRVGRR